MRKPASSTQAQDLLDDLTRLHQQLTGEKMFDSVPLLEDIISAPQPDSLSFEQQLLIHSAEKILPEIIQDFTPLIAQELSRRLQQELRRALEEQQISDKNHPPR
ncbi:MAG: hypothetical protein M0Q29_06740 [Thiopseudomonas sp.]|nr:hypothetical protein [Thiopseudomonas sp.]